MNAVSASSDQDDPPAARLARLREALRRQNLDGLLVPSSDEQLNEYVGDHARRLRWLTGFDGSTGLAIVLRDSAALVVDSRYVRQATEQTAGGGWQVVEGGMPFLKGWISSILPPGATIGYDPRLHSWSFIDTLTMALAGTGIAIVPLEVNPVDALWRDRPLAPNAGIRIHPLELAGVPAAEKRRTLAQRLRDGGCDAAILASPESTAWLFNVRGADTPHSPVAAAVTIATSSGGATLFVAAPQVSAEMQVHLGEQVETRPLAHLPDALATLAGDRVMIDPDRTPAALVLAAQAAGVRLVEQVDPIIAMRARKNPAEIAGHRRAQGRDAAVLAEMLYWLSTEGPRGVIAELDVVRFLAERRGAFPQFYAESFPTIAAAGANGAMVHYTPSAESNRTIESGDLVLIDSGGQYVDGTTDVTRTIWIGPQGPPAHLRERYTRVLKGHIALATAIFPDGTPGAHLDGFARRPLWAAGLDYPHGTGHGVGSFLSVHEGPQRIARPRSCREADEEPLRAGMIVSNEPGHYRAGEYGMRIENLMLVETRIASDADVGTLGFETLSFAPLDRALIDISLLTPDERTWIDAYHMATLAIAGPSASPDVRNWLESVCAPLA